MPDEKPSKLMRNVFSLADASDGGITYVERITTRALRHPNPFVCDTGLLEEIYQRGTRGLEVAKKVRREDSRIVLRAGLLACMHQAKGVMCFRIPHVSDGFLEETYEGLRESADVILPLSRKSAGLRYDVTGFFSKRVSKDLREGRDEPWLKRQFDNYKLCFETLGGIDPQFAANAASQAGYAAEILAYRKDNVEQRRVALEYLDHFLTFYEENPTKDSKLLEMVEEVKVFRARLKRFLIRARA